MTLARGAVLQLIDLVIEITLLEAVRPGSGWPRPCWPQAWRTWQTCAGAGSKRDEGLLPSLGRQPVLRWLKTEASPK